MAPHDIRLVLPPLDEITGTVHARMTYDRFDDLITQKFAVVVRNWPLKNFCNPSSVGSRIELETLYNGWQSGATRFEKLSTEEMTAWENERFASRLAVMSATPPKSMHSPPPDVSLPASSRPSIPPNSDILQLSTTAQPTAHNPIISHTPNPALTTGLTLQRTPDPELITNMIRCDPSLQNIDPILLAAGAFQESQRPTTVATPTSALPIDCPPPATHSKRNRDAFQVVTPQSYGTLAKRPRKAQREKGSKRVPVPRGSENALPGSTATS